MMAAPLISLAATGLSAAGSIAGAEGQSKADQYQAQQAINAAQYGRTKAAQTGTIMTQNMQAMLGHIQAVRDSFGSDPRSPTTAAIMSNQEQMAQYRKYTEIGNIQNQVNEDVASSKMYNQMAGQALTAGYLGAAGTAVGSLGGLFKGSGNGSSSAGGSSFNFFGF